MKRISQFYHFFLTGTALLAVSSCGKQHGLESSAFSTSAVVSPTRNLTTAERTIATRICYAYQSKNTTLRMQTYYGGTFNFNVNYRDCANVKSSATVATVLTTSTTDTKKLTFSTDTTLPFNKTVQTASSGFLSQLCSKIQNNLAISNTTVDSGTTIQIAFTSSDMDTYTLQYFAKTNNVMKIQSAETYKVRTQFNIVANQILGMDESYAQQKICAGSADQFSDYSQVYSNFISK